MFIGDDARIEPFPLAAISRPAVFGSGTAVEADPAPPDPNGKRRGMFGLQILSGEPMEVRFRNLKLEMLDPATAE